MTKLSYFKIGKQTFDMSKPHIVGVLNMTPDSFSDGGQFLDTDRALVQIEKLIQDGASIIDIGAESTRPGADNIDASKQIQRLSPVVKAYKKYFSAPLSIDTTNSDVFSYCLSNGADMLNDVSGLQDDLKMIDIVSEAGCSVVIMHRQGMSKTMQDDPHYKNVIDEIASFFSDTCRKLKSNDVSSILIDPGIGFGKSLDHNLKILRNLDELCHADFPLFIGTSRKSFIEHVTGASFAERLPGTIASNLYAFQKGARFFRVHDVKELKQSFDIHDAIINGDINKSRKVGDKIG